MTKSLLIIRVLLAAFMSVGHTMRVITKEKDLTFSTKVTNTKNDGSLGYILFPGRIPWIPVPIRVRPTTTAAPTTTTITTTTTVPNPTTIPPDGGVHIPDVEIGANEFKYYNFDLPLGGLLFLMTNVDGFCIGYFSYTNPTPNESNREGMLPPGPTSTYIPFREINKKRYTYQGSSNVFISVRGMDAQNTARIRITRAA